MNYTIIKIQSVCKELCNRTPESCNVCSRLGNVTLDDPIQYVIFDFSGLDTICSTMLSNMIVKNKKMVLCNCSQRIKQVLSITKFDSIMPILKTVDDAILYCTGGK